MLNLGIFVNKTTAGTKLITYLPTTFRNKIEKYKIYYSDETILKFQRNGTMIDIIN